MKHSERGTMGSAVAHVRRVPDSKAGSRRREEADGMSLPAVHLVTSAATAGGAWDWVESVSTVGYLSSVNSRPKNAG